MTPLFTKGYCLDKGDQFAVQSAWNRLLDLANDKRYKEIMKGIASVYLVTLLHFITDGEYPIYDRFAMASLAVWKLKKIYSELTVTDETIIRGCSLPSKETKAAKKSFE